MPVPLRVTHKRHDRPDDEVVVEAEARHFGIKNYVLSVDQGAVYQETTDGSFVPLNDLVPRSKTELVGVVMELYWTSEISQLAKGIFMAEIKNRSGYPEDSPPH